MSEEKHYNEPQVDESNGDTVENLIKEMVCMEVLMSNGVSLNEYNMLNVDAFIAGVKRIFDIENEIADLPEDSEIPDDLLEEYIDLNGNHIITHLILIRSGMDEGDITAIQSQALFEFEFEMEATNEMVEKMKDQILDIIETRRIMKQDILQAIHNQMGDAFDDTPLALYVIE